MYDYDDYVKKYATKHEITTEEAKEHKVVKAVEELAEKDTREKIPHCNEGG